MRVEVADGDGSPGWRALGAGVVRFKALSHLFIYTQVALFSTGGAPCGSVLFLFPVCWSLFTAGSGP